MDNCQHYVTVYFPAATKKEAKKIAQGLRKNYSGKPEFDECNPYTRPGKAWHYRADGPHYEKAQEKDYIFHIISLEEDPEAISEDEEWDYVDRSAGPGIKSRNGIYY